MKIVSVLILIGILVFGFIAFVEHNSQIGPSVAEIRKQGLEEKEKSDQTTDSLHRYIAAVYEVKLAKSSGASDYQIQRLQEAEIARLHEIRDPEVRESALKARMAEYR